MQNGVSRWFDRAGKEMASAGQPGRIMNFALSPDEQRVVVARQGSQANHWDLWIGEWQRGTELRFTSNVSMNRDAVWAPNGGQIIFSSTRAGRTDLPKKLLRRLKRKPFSLGFFQDRFGLVPRWLM